MHWPGPKLKLKAGRVSILFFLTSLIERGSSVSMLGFLFNERECRELDYVLRKELDEMLFDLNDKRIDADIKVAIESRYKVIFRMYARLASPREISKYARNRMQH
ncbi:hypothetical protein B2K_35455 [Paenibacillus mucilaginosus K02]|uniref:Uncharacterized protein n=2 Tax=Paenibacillus mucilaginosus TaxID=61624 RepID=I0BU95_9BACL|nr:hypothetical protein B2K_35455 [Paenibacillus mucilaginosus K02]